MSKRSTKSKAWRKCAGVNSRTGRVKKGYRVTRGGCPTKVIKGARRSRKKIAYYTGSGYNTAAEAYFARQPGSAANRAQKEAEWRRSGFSGLRGAFRRRRRR